MWYTKLDSIQQYPAITKIKTIQTQFYRLKRYFLLFEEVVWKDEFVMLNLLSHLTWHESFAYP